MIKSGASLLRYFIVSQCTLILSNTYSVGVCSEKLLAVYVHILYWWIYNVTLDYQTLFRHAIVIFDKFLSKNCSILDEKIPKMITVHGTMKLNRTPAFYTFQYSTIFVHFATYTMKMGSL